MIKYGLLDLQLKLTASVGAFMLKSYCLTQCDILSGAGTYNFYISWFSYKISGIPSFTLVVHA